MPPLYALRDAMALPSAVRAPVELFQGCHCFISSACLCRRAGVQPFAMMLVLQKFVLLIDSFPRAYGRVRTGLVITVIHLLVA
jgi:hypothetical protein